jgi:hypothetical protein
LFNPPIWVIRSCGFIRSDLFILLISVAQLFAAGSVSGCPYG